MFLQRALKQEKKEKHEENSEKKREGGRNKKEKPEKEKWKMKKNEKENNLKIRGGGGNPCLNHKWMIEVKVSRPWRSRCVNSAPTSSELVRASY